MSSGKANELNADVTELKDLLRQASRKRVQDFISLEISKLETQLIALRDAEKASLSQSEQSADSKSPVASSSNALTKRYQIKLNGYGWDQSDKYVKLFVTLKNVQNIPKESVFCNLTERSMEMNVTNLDNKDYLLVINNLLHPIDVSASHWKQKTDMVVIFLAKVKQNENWSHMTEIEKRFEDNKSNRFKDEIKDDKSADPQDSLMSMMRNMYEKGDDNMKQIIAKAWTEGQEKKLNSGI